MHLVEPELHRFQKSYADTLADEGLPVPTIRKRLGHCSLDVTLAYLRGREAEDEQEQNFANQSALAVYDLNTRFDELTCTSKYFSGRK